MRAIACFGDSLIYGFPFGAECSWLAAGQAARGLTMENSGVCGDCCDGILLRLRTGMLPAQLRHVLFLGGANDLLERRPQQFIISDLLEAAAWCAGRGLHLCLALPLLSSSADLNQRLLKLRASIRNAMPAQVFLLDLQEALGFTPAQLARAYLDGVHPTLASYRALGTWAAPLLAHWLLATAAPETASPDGN